MNIRGENTRKYLHHAIRISTILFQYRGVADLTYTLKVTQMDYNHQPQPFFLNWMVNYNMFRSNKKTSSGK